MPVVLVIAGALGGATAAASAWLGAGVPIWMAILIYLLVGNAVCLACAGLVLLKSVVCPGFRRLGQEDADEAEPEVF